MRRIFLRSHVARDAAKARRVAIASDLVNAAKTQVLVSRDALVRMRAMAVKDGLGGSKYILSFLRNTTRAICSRITLSFIVPLNVPWEYSG